MNLRSILTAVAAGLFIAIPSVGLTATFTCTQTQCDGTSDPDTIHDSQDHVMNSVMKGNYGGFDIAYGHDRNDNIEGGNDPDTVRGHLGADYITTGHNYESPDWGIGNDGNDTIKDEWPGVGSTCGSGCDKDRLCGGDGDDNLYLKDGDNEDQYNAGNGSDYVEKDSNNEPNVAFDTCTSGSQG